VKVGAENLKDARKKAFGNLPPIPTVKNLNACSEVGIAVLDEIRDDLQEYLEKI